MVEVLSYDPRSAVNAAGDVVPVDDVFTPDNTFPLTDEQRYELAEEEDTDLQATIDEIRANGNFHPRNAAIAKAGDFVAKARRSDGAAHLYASGIDTTDIRGAASAASREVEERTAAINLGEQACKLCPLAEYCDLKGGFIPLVHASSTQRAAIDDAKTRRDRLRSKVKSGNFKKNNHFCKTNMQPGRLKKDVA